ncbi:hypothetical protein C1I97_36930 [Streptomyces sp. NTH33]|uniref:hypothetical protein n=1 Tax=Streptomyces sp. NTH33 TaxID=1735453 RepID=UPI000DA74263|nr:hypothetical protein [Streptomyces sp. NTH33]PZG77292.1 hypothetical protein C1I97_36930 [Streptomyces sp. NTH33]
MTRPAIPPHRQVVAAALEDWWLTTDPTAPFDYDQVADHVELHLVSSGYRISHDTRRTSPVPTVRAIATVALLGTATTASTVYTALHSNWWWTALGALATALLTREAIRDLTDRHRGRSAR